jgi:outer membrane lipoprotein-sorting protein
METENTHSSDRDSVLKALGSHDRPDAEFLARLRERAAEEFANAPAEASQTPESLTLSPWRAFMKSRLFKAAAVAAVIAIVAIVGLQFAGGTSAYAQVVEQIKSARTIVYTLIRQANDGSGKTINVDVAYKDPGHLRTSTVDGYIAIVDFTTGKMISIVPQGGYTMGDVKDLGKGGAPHYAEIEAMKALPSKPDLRVAAKDIDGALCDGYQVAQGDMTTTVWLNAKTGDVVQVEHKYASAPGMNTIMKNIQLDPPLEDSLFSLTPPAGFKQMGEIKGSGSSSQNEQTFVDWLRWWAGGNVDETFPPMVAGAEIAKAVMEMATSGKLKPEVWQKGDANPRMFDALMFVARLPQGSWRYAGNGVKVNTPDTPIFWYKPAGQELYRVVYADLTIRELPADQLPK